MSDASNGNSSKSISRRDWLAASGIAAVGGLASLNNSAQAAETDSTLADQSSRFTYCINTSTIREKKLPLPEIVDMAAAVGYNGIEPWIREIEAYQQAGGSLADMRKRISDHGLKVESAIGFAHWIVDDPTKRKAGLEQAKRDMELVAAIGGTRIAAPPTGATKQNDLDLFAAAKRFGDLMKVGESIGVTPQAEVWGFSQSLSRLGETAFVVIESGNPNALILPDVYHIFKGGSDFAGLNLLSGKAIQVFHMNDYPATPDRKTINDAHRVYPGDGVAPLDQILQTLSEIGFQGALSLELFNRDYWKQDPRLVLETGLAKMKQAVAKAFG